MLHRPPRVRVAIGVLFTVATLFVGILSANAGPLILVPITLPAGVSCTLTPTSGSVTWTNPYGATVYIKTTRLFVTSGLASPALFDVVLSKLNGTVPIHGMSWRLSASGTASDQTTHTPDYFELGPGQSLLLWYQCSRGDGLTGGLYTVAAQVIHTVANP